MPYCIAAGNVALAVQHLTNRGHLSGAMLVVAAADDGTMPFCSENRRQRCRIKFEVEDCEEQTSCDYVTCTVEKIADWYFTTGRQTRLVVNDH